MDTGPVAGTRRWTRIYCHNGVPLSKYDDWMREHANDTVTIAIRGQAQELTHKLSDFPAVKKLYKQQY